MHSKISDEEVKVLAEVLTDITSVTELSLSYNDITEAGAKDLAEMLKQNTVLTALGLSANNVKGAGAKALAEALKTNTALNSLGLWGNNIDSSGIKAIAEMLKYKTHLRYLDVSGGSHTIGDSEAQIFAEVLKDNKTLMTLRLWNGSIGDKGAQAFAEMLKQNTTLKRLDLSGNKIGALGMQAFKALLEGNQNTILIWLNLVTHENNAICDQKHDFAVIIDRIGYNVDAYNERTYSLQNELYELSKQLQQQQNKNQDLSVEKLSSDKINNQLLDELRKTKQSLSNMQSELYSNQKALYVAKERQPEMIVIINDARINREIAAGSNLEKCRNIILGFTAISNDNIEDTISLSQFSCISKQQISFTTIICRGDTAISAIRVEGQKDYVACIYNFDADNFEFNDLIAEDLIMLGQQDQC